MTFFLVGTIAELIKLFPVMKGLEDSGQPFRIVATGQNDLAKSDLLGHLATRVEIRLHEGPIRQTAAGLLAWFARTLASSFFRLRRQIPGPVRRASTLVIHGDTVSTLMGAVLGRLLGFRVAHLEAGLRSFRLFSPFPEEICRRFVSRLASVHFCPNDWAVGNLRRRRGVKVSTGGNTLLDSLEYSRRIAVGGALAARLAGQRYFIFVIHRQENIYDETLARSLVDQIAAKTRDGLKCLFIMHEPTRIAFDSYGLSERLENLPNALVSPRLDYLEFMKVLSGAEFIVTDGGSNQEECFYLGIPCLLLRSTTERTEGLGENVVLSRHDRAVVAEFLAEPGQYRRSPQRYDRSPSEVVRKRLAESAG